MPMTPPTIVPTTAASTHGDPLEVRATLGAAAAAGAPRLGGAAVTAVPATTGASALPSGAAPAGVDGETLAPPMGGAGLTVAVMVLGTIAGTGPQM